MAKIGEYILRSFLKIATNNLRESEYLKSPKGSISIFGPYKLSIMAIKKFLITWLITFSMLFFGCYPIGPTFVEELDAVYTVRSEPGWDFSDPTITTYYIVDSVVEITDPNQMAPTVINKDQILQEVIRNMDMMGYTRLTGVDSVVAPQADYVVLVSINRSNNYFYNFWPGWGMWGGWGWWGMPPCCFFPPTVTVSVITTGSLVVELMDGRRLGKVNTDMLPEVWLGVAQGLYQGSAQNINTRTQNGVNQMFAQAPYLRR